MNELVQSRRGLCDEPFEARAYVDTGPVQERVYAQRAELGWIGKNTCVINAERGSWIFLSAIISTLALESDAPALDQCGACTLCLETIDALEALIGRLKSTGRRVTLPRHVLYGHNKEGLRCPQRPVRRSVTQVVRR